MHPRPFVPDGPRNVAHPFPRTEAGEKTGIVRFDLTNSEQEALALRGRYEGARGTL